MPVTAELWQLVPAIVGYFLRSLQPKPNSDHTGADVADFSSGGVLWEPQRMATFFVYFFSILWNSRLVYTIFFP